MLYVLPDYYPEFHCLAGDCEDTCCAGWQIVVDGRSLKRYRAHRGPYRKALLRSVNWKEKCFRQDQEKRCAFLNEENLCEMYRHLGPDSLCRTCRLYPRHIEEFENVREISLSVSCPEAARLLLYRQEPLKFREFQREGEETYGEFDELFYSRLTECRELMIRILQHRELPLKLRCGLSTGLANDMQNYFREGRLFQCQELFWRVETSMDASGGVAARMRAGAADRTSGGAVGRTSGGQPDGCGPEQDGKTLLEITKKKMACCSDDCFEWIRDMFAKLHRFECLKADWPLWLGETEDWLYEGGPEAYRQTEQEFLAWMERDTLDWQIPFEQLLVYFLFTYFCGAVYDGEILASAQLGVVHCWLIREMLMAVWLRNGKTVDLEDLRELVIRYSRELEHSDVNQKKMEKIMAGKRLPWLRGRKRDENRDNI